MARLFITPKEIQFINDTVKEIIKDVNSQKIYYYAISTEKSRVDLTYDEAVNKIFENPVIIDAIVGQPEWESKHNKFGMEQSAKVEVFIQARDLIDKNLNINEGDYFTYGDATYEIETYINLNNIFGQEEYDRGMKMVGRLARPGTFDPPVLLKPTKDSAGNLLDTGVQPTFVQQRGLSENEEGPTRDVRQIRERLKEDMSEPALGEGPRKVALEPDENISSFYNE